MSGPEIQLTRERQPRPELPGFWRFCWMFWMQPILLHELLLECGIDKPDASAIQLWRINDAHRSIRREYVTRLAVMLCLGMPVISFSFAGILSICGTDADFAFVTLGIAIGVVIGAVIGVAFGIAFGVAFGAAIGLALGVEFGVAIAVADSFAFAVRFAVVGGVATAVATAIAHGVANGVAVGVAFSPIFADAIQLLSGSRFKAFLMPFLKAPGVIEFFIVLDVVFGVLVGIVLGILLGMAYGFVFGAVFGIVFGIAFAGAIVRAPIWPFEIVASSGARIAARVFGGSPLRFSPVNWHDLCYVPLPGLRQQILDEAPRNPILVRQTLQACRRSPSQYKIVEDVLSALKAREWKRLIQSRQFENAGEMRGEWLSQEQESDARLQELSEASRYLRAANIAVVPRHRRHQVERAQQVIQSLRNRSLINRSHADVEIQSALEAVELLAAEMLAEAKQLAEGQLPNPYRAGEPLTPEFDATIFRGRKDLVRQIELLLDDEQQAAAVSLIAPRRCGKSSLLRMLPAKLPDALCVFFDLQDNPIQAPLDLFPALEKRLLEQVRPQNRDSMPRLRDASLEAARDWLEALEQRPGRDRVLFCLDEFERLEVVVGEKPETKQQLVQLMGLLRATIQHRRRVRLLVAGNWTFEELGPLWNDTFISARELRLGPLARDVAIGLLRQPIPVEEGFPDDAIPLSVAEAIVDRTGGQPYLTQLYGFWLVEELNRTKRKQAELTDVEAVDQIVFEQAAPFFRDSLNPRGATFAVKPIIEQIVAGQTPDLTGPQSRFLTRRGLITPEGTLAFPILARWLNESAE